MTITESKKIVQPEPEIAFVPDSSVVAVPVEQPQMSTSSQIIKSNSFHIILCGDFELHTTSIGRRNIYITLCGDHTLDLRRVQFPTTAERISVVIIKLCGDIRLIVPESVSVSTCAIMLCGDKRIDTAADSTSFPHVQLTVVTLCGNVIITNKND